MDWVDGFLIPLISVTLVGGIITYVLFGVGRGIYRTWKQHTKWFIKYKIRRKPYPEKTMRWVWDCIDNGVGYYDAKKLLYVHNGNDMDLVYETLFIFEEFLIELNKDKNNKIKHGKHQKKEERTMPNLYEPMFLNN